MSSRAFTLVETLIVTAIIGSLMAVLISFTPRRKDDSWKNITDGVNSFITFARQEAIIRGSIHKILIVSKESESYLTLLRSQVGLEGKKIYKEVKNSYIDTKYTFPKTVSVERVFIGGKESEENLAKGAHLHITPNGMIEDCFFFVTRGIDRATFTLSPFVGKFEYKEGFVRS